MKITYWAPKASPIATNTEAGQSMTLQQFAMWIAGTWSPSRG